MSSDNQFLPRRLFDAVYEMNAASNHVDFISSVANGLSRMIASDLLIIHVLDRQNQRLVHSMVPDNPFSDAELEHYKNHPDENPMVAYYERTGDTRARRISDIMDREVWLQSNHYLNCLSRLNRSYMLALPITVDATTIAGLNFDRTHSDFSQEDCALLDAFAPHFKLAWKRHPNPWRQHPDQKSEDSPLTTRETDVLYWITAGKQNREIAIILGISLYTVQKHVANILRKLDVENRHALTVLTLNRTN